MSATRIAVVGAGIAGLTAARRLSRAGCELLVFDKARGVGGRTSTRRKDPVAFDHGAQYFTCRTERFSLQAEDWCRRGVAAPFEAPVRSLGRGPAADTRRDTVRYVGVPGMSALARDLASDLTVSCGTRIAGIERPAGESRGWRLVDDEGRDRGEFDAVVLATPAPQAAPLLAAVPQLADRARSVEVLPCHAVMVHLPEPLDAGFGGAFVGDSPLAWVARNSSKPGRPVGECWVLHADSGWSAAHLDAPPDVVSKALLRAFGDAIGRALPTPVSATVHLWRFARTGAPLGAPERARPWDAGSSIGVCGDWTHGARVEDAFTSGEHLAEVMLAESPLAAGSA